MRTRFRDCLPGSSKPGSEGNDSNNKHEQDRRLKSKRASGWEAWTPTDGAASNSKQTVGGVKKTSTAIAARDLAKAREKGLSQTRPTGDTAYALRASRDAKIKAAESGEICGEPAVRQPLRPFRINAK